MRKITSLVVALCFVLNSVSFAFDSRSVNIPRGNTNLSAPLMLDDLSEGTVHDKYKSLAKMRFLILLKKALAAHPELKNNPDFKDLKAAFFQAGNERGIFPELMHKISDDIFYMPVGVKDETYHILFSTRPLNDTDMKLTEENFPIVVCNKDQWRKQGDEIIERARKGQLPVLSARENRMIDSFAAQEKYDDFLEWAHKNELTEQINIAPFIDNIEQMYGITIKDHPGLTEIRKRGCFLISLEGVGQDGLTVKGQIEECLLPVWNERTGKVEKVKGYAHSSNRSFHFVLPKAIIELIKEGKIKGYAEFYKKFNHELGVITGRPVRNIRDGKPINDFDHDDYLGMVTLTDGATFDVVDLDILRGRNSDGTKYERDFAASGEQIARREAVISNIDAALKEIDGALAYAPEREKDIWDSLRASLIELKERVLANPDVPLLDTPLSVGGYPETKEGEHRAIPIPDVVRALTALRIPVNIFQTSEYSVVMGKNCGFDSQYENAGAALRSGADIATSSDILHHVKEMQAEDIGLFSRLIEKGKKLVYYAFNHLAGDKTPTREIAAAHIGTGATLVSFENIVKNDGYPILRGPSEKAGVVSAYMGALQLLSRFAINAEHELAVKRAIKEYDRTDVPPAPLRLEGQYSEVVYGGGAVGYNHARTMARMDIGKVTVIETNPERREWLKQEFKKEGLTNVKVIDNTPELVLVAIREAKLIATTTYRKGERAQCLITNKMKDEIGRGKVYIVVDIDQGGGVEDAPETSHEKPFVLKDGDWYYAVPNIPALVPRQTSIDISLAAFPDLALMSLYGLENAVKINPALANAVDAADGRITSPVIDKELSGETDNTPGIDSSMRMVTDFEEMTPLEKTLWAMRIKATAIEALTALPAEYNSNPASAQTIIEALTRIEGINIPEGLKVNENTGIIFSEELGCVNGLVVLLPRLAECGVNVACIATHAKHREIIQNLEKLASEKAGKQILLNVADNVPEAMSLMGAPNACCFRVEGEEDERYRGVVNIFIPKDKIALILRNLGKIFKASVDALIRATGIIASAA